MDLYATVHEKGYDLASIGFFSNLRGHIGEWQAIRDFAQFQPSVPVSSANPGWDLKFGDHGYANVKVVNDATSGLAHHLADHSDVSVIMNCDAAHIPAHALFFSPGEHLDPEVFYAWQHSGGGLYPNSSANRRRGSQCHRSPAKRCSLPLPLDHYDRRRHRRDITREKR